jgi:large subunit ribosomal protein L22
MGQKENPRRTTDTQARAVGSNIRVSPRKLNLVAQQIRGRRVEDALNVLTFSEKRIARDVKKILQSAIANAENNHDLDVDDLVVAEASVGRTIVMKRFHARARGRGARVEKPFAQITIMLEEKKPEKVEKKVNLSPERRKPDHPKAKAEGGDKPKAKAKGKPKSKTGKTAGEKA